MAQAPRDSNRIPAILVKDTISSAATPASGILTGSVESQAVAIVDGSGTQITSFGGGTQYTDGAAAPANPVGNTIEWNEGGTWRTVSTAKPLPVAASLTNPSTGAAVPATANYIAANKGGNLTGLLIGSQTTTNSLAVALASDQVSIPVAATLSAETTKVIGTINVAAAQTIAVTNAGTFAVTQGTGSNLHAVIDSGTITTVSTVTTLSQFAGNAINLGTGTVSTGTLRVVLATDQAQLTNKLLVTPDANSSINLNQIAGNGISTGVGVTGTGVIRTVEANAAGRTLASAGGSAASSGNNTLVAAGTNKLKVFAFSLSTTSTTSVTCIFQSGAGGTELWRVVLQAPTSVSTGANLVVPVPSYLFATASATLLNLNLSAAQTVHWAVSYFDEA